MANDDKIEVREHHHAGTHVTRVDKTKYEAMRSAMLAVLTPEQPGMTQAEYKTALLPLLPDDLFPGGEKAGWWTKCVQLDLEAKGIVARSATKPLRFYRI